MTTTSTPPSADRGDTVTTSPNPPSAVRADSTTTTLTCTATRDVAGATPGIAGYGRYLVRCQLPGTDHEWHEARRGHETYATEGDLEVTTNMKEIIRWR